MQRTAGRHPATTAAAVWRKIVALIFVSSLIAACGTDGASDDGTRSSDEVASATVATVEQAQDCPSPSEITEALSGVDLSEVTGELQGVGCLYTGPSDQPSSPDAPELSLGLQTVPLDDLRADTTYFFDVEVPVGDGVGLVQIDDDSESQQHGFTMFLPTSDASNPTMMVVLRVPGGSIGGDLEAMAQRIAVSLEPHL